MADVLKSDFFTLLPSAWCDYLHVKFQHLALMTQLHRFGSSLKFSQEILFTVWAKVLPVVHRIWFCTLFSI